MTKTDRIMLYYSPQSRATGARVLLEELGAPYDLARPEHESRGSSASRPTSRLIRSARCRRSKHGDALVTEQIAITIYLADLFPRSGPDAVA